MRVSIPGVPGVYYDTDSGSTAIGVATTAIGRKAPKPKGYAIQLLPYLWSFEVDLHEVPTDHPIQYLHPEGAQSLGELSPERGVRQAGTELESVLRFVWSVNQEVESATNRLIGRSPAHEGAVIEIQDGSVSVDGDELETDAFDLEESVGESTPEAEAETATGTETSIEINADRDDDTESAASEEMSESLVEDGEDEEKDEDTDEDVFGATEEPPADEDGGSDSEFGSGDESGEGDDGDENPDEPSTSTST